MPRKLLSEAVAELRRLASHNPSPSRREVQQVVADLPGCVFVADGNGRMVAASKLALATLGHTLATFRALTIHDLAAGAERDAVEPLWESFQRQRRQSGNYHLRTKDGSVRTRYAAVANVVGDLSVSVHVVATVTSARPT